MRLLSILLKNSYCHVDCCSQICQLKIYKFSWFCFFGFFLTMPTFKKKSICKNRKSTTWLIKKLRELVIMILCNFRMLMTNDELKPFVNNGNKRMFVHFIKKRPCASMPASLYMTLCSKRSLPYCYFNI